jgi:hypothetical protein
MSKGGSSQAQQPVNPAALGAAQTSSNVATAEQQAGLNNANVNSPFGSSWWQGTATDPSTGLPTSYALNQNLNTTFQGLLNQQTGLAGNIAGAAGTALGQGGQIGSMGMGLINQGAGYAPNIQPTANFGNVPTIPTLTPSSFSTNVTGGAGGQALTPVQTGVAPGGPIQTSVGSNFPQLVQQAQDAAYQQQTQYLDPQFSQSRQQLTQMLADQGVQPGTEAYDRATGDLNRQQQMAYQSAQSSAVAAGNAQEQSLFGQSLGAGTFANAAQQQQYGQNLAGMQAGNQAQNQMFGQGFQLSNLYNQAVLGAAGQNAQAQAGNLNLAQAQFQDPMSALTTLLGAGQGLYGTGVGSIGAALPAVGAAPTWPLGIPTMGGTPTNISPTNLGATTSAATQQNALANMANRQQFGDIGSLAGALGTGGNIGSLFNQGGVFGSGGLLSNLFGPATGATTLGASALGGIGAGAVSATPPAMDALSTMLLAAAA